MFCSPAYSNSKAGMGKTSKRSPSLNTCFIIVLVVLVVLSTYLTLHICKCPLKLLISPCYVVNQCRVISLLSRDSVSNPLILSHFFATHSSQATSAKSRIKCTIKNVAFGRKKTLSGEYIMLLKNSLPTYGTCSNVLP